MVVMKISKGKKNRLAITPGERSFADLFTQVNVLFRGTGTHTFLLLVTHSMGGEAVLSEITPYRNCTIVLRILQQKSVKAEIVMERMSFQHTHKFYYC